MNLNPYREMAGPELDSLLSRAYFNDSESQDPRRYSTDEKSANMLKVQIENLYGHAVVTGRMRVKIAPYFARLNTDPSTSTETTADTYALAIARLGLVLAVRRGDLKEADGARANELRFGHPR